MADRAMGVRCGTAFVLSTLLGHSAWAADFEPPKDGKLTEKEVVGFIATQKEQLDAIKAAQNATAGSQSGAANLAVVTRMSQKIDAAAEKHGLSRAEFDWVSSQFGQLWPIATMQQQWEDSGKPDLQQQIKAKQDEATAAKAKQAQYEQAQHDGKRILTKEQQDSAVSSAKSDRESASGEVKSAQEAVQQITDEAAGHDKEATTADGLAKAPPAEVSADDKQGYIDGKKAEAQTARDAAKESLNKLPDAQKALADAKAKVALLDGKVAHPELPTTDDERSQVKQENEAAITDAKSSADAAQQAVTTLKEALDAGPAVPTEPKLDADNLALAKKHIKEYWAAIGMPDPSVKK